MTQSSLAQQALAQQISASSPSELSAPISDVEPETTATAARSKPKTSTLSKVKRSYKTVEPCKRRQLIQMVHTEQKTIKEAANRLKINYSTAKHIIKSTKNEVVEQIKPAEPAHKMTDFQLPIKQAAPVDIMKLERKIQALTESSPSLITSSLVGAPPKTFNSSLLSTSLSLGQSLSPQIHSISQSLTTLGVHSCDTSTPQVIIQPLAKPLQPGQSQPSLAQLPPSLSYEKLIKPLPVPLNPSQVVQTGATGYSNPKMLLLAALVHHLRIQRSPTETDRSPLSASAPEEQAHALAPTLAKILSSSPKLMIEVAIEMTKLTQSEIRLHSSGSSSEGRNRSESAPALNLSARDTPAGSGTKTSLIAAQPSLAKRLL